MQLVVLKYLQILCVTVFFSNNIICDNVVVDREQKNINKISACAAAKCMSNEMGNDLQTCYNECLKDVESLRELTGLLSEKPPSYHMHCRDSSRIVLKVNTEELMDSSNRSFVYLINVHRTKEPYYQIIYLTNDSLIEIKNLTASMSYNVTATIISSNYEYKKMGRKVVTTLKEEYIPDTITNITAKFELNPYDNNTLTASVQWSPARDATCIYDIIYHSQTSGELKIVELRELSDFYHHRLSPGYDFHFNHNYSFTIRGINTKNHSLDGKEEWTIFETPTCLETHKSLEFCPPERIEDILKDEIYLGDDLYNLNISWISPQYKPWNYSIEILETDEHFYRNVVATKTIDGQLNFASFPKIKLSESFYEISIMAESSGGEQTSIFSNNRLEKRIPSPRRSIAVLYLFLIFSLLMVLLIFLIFKRRADLRKIEEFQMQSFDLMLRRSKIENFNELFAISDDPLEIPRNKIRVFELLGEGAFGVVKKGLLASLNGSNEELVAIKMLKENASFSEIRQFRMEIDMMKSVKRHPNILSIIGHCTKKIEELMLITEYCDRGNLLDFLRLEWHRRYECAFPIVKSKPAENVFNLDINFSRKETSYKNFPFKKIFGAEFDTNNNDPLNQKKFKSICAVNPLYLENDVLLSTSSQEPYIENPLSVSDLISFAIQVADGMHFLSKNKIVHRDLAARNILCCSNNTVKIADFGLSRDICNYNQYRKTSSGKLPIKWLAIECMTHQVYTTQSDVWSFGILLFEIVTLGGTPYPSLQTAKLLTSLQEGYRMEKPKHCGPNLYDLMLCCWNENPKERPNFKKIYSRLQEIARKEENLVDLDSIFNDSDPADFSYQFNRKT